MAVLPSKFLQTKTANPNLLKESHFNISA